MFKIKMKTSISIFETILLPETEKLFEGNGIDFNDILDASPVPSESIFTLEEMGAFIVIGSPEKLPIKIISTLGNSLQDKT